MAISFSPLIENGDLVINNRGLLKSAPDIQTQLYVTLVAYNCIYNTQINSKVVPYVLGTQTGGFNQTTLYNLIVKAYTPILITPGLITNLSIKIQPPLDGYVNIKISALDQSNNPVQLTWSNLT